MKRWLARGCGILAVAVCLVTHAQSTAAPLETVRAVRALGPAEAEKSVPVHLRGIVTFYDPEQQVLFFQDSTGAIYIDSTVRYSIAAGSRVEIWGATAKGYTTEVKPTAIREISRGLMPKAPFVTYATAARHESDCRYVTMEGVVRSATVQVVGPARVYLLQVELGGNIIEIAVSRFPNFDPTKLLDATIRATGNIGGNFNPMQQIVGLQLLLSDASQLQIVQPAKVDPFHIPLTPLATFVSSDRILFGNDRVRTRGYLTLYDPGERLVIHEGISDLFVQTRQIDPMPIGSLVEVTGFPAPSNGSPTLEYAQAAVVGPSAPLVSRTISFADAMTGQYSNNLVTMEGELVSQTHEKHLDTLTLRVGDKIFEAVHRRQLVDNDSFPVFEPGTRVKITGICLVHVRGFWGSVESFQVQFRSRDDVVVLGLPTWWTVRHMLYLTSALLFIATVTLLWGLWIRRRLSYQEKLVRQQIESEAARLASLARLEQQRSRILELINSFEPLPSVFAAIHAHAAEMWPGVSSYSHTLRDRKLILLSGSNHSSSDRERLQTVDPTHSSEPCAMAVKTRGFVSVSSPRDTWSRPLLSSHGEILATMTFEAEPGKAAPFNHEAFEFGCNLATIAIDNRRLYEDALHRSRHDQLTGLANRALMDERIEQALRKAKENSTMAAVLFLDLDDFKPVNDRFSHRIGDLYLCEVARRFQACLRSADTLGRVGGDEFIGVIANLINPGEVDAVARRLVQAMHTPIVVEGIAISGTVSIGVAIDPDSRTSANELKHLADAAMYEAKRGGGNRIVYAPGSSEQTANKAVQNEQPEEMSGAFDLQRRA